jgi:hypothetical protein
MKAFALILFALVSPSSFAESIHFTTVFYDDAGIVYVGLKHGTGAGEAQIISFPYPPLGDRTKIPLPEEISHRDVIGLIPDRQKLFVLTSGGGEKLDGPMLHLFDQKKNEWKKIGKIDCPAFTKVKISSTKMVFFCEVPGSMRRGKLRVRAKTLRFGRERIYRTGTWRFPEFMLRYKGVVLLLQGEAPNWDKLRLKNEKDDRLIKAEDLFDLPNSPAISVPSTPTGNSASPPATP